MRIAQVSPVFPPYYSGTGQVCYHNALELARRGHEVTVFTSAYPNGAPVYPSEITVRRLPMLLRFGNAPVLPGLLGIKDFDLIHLHFPFVSGAELVALVARARKIPLVITHHNDLIGDGLRRFLFPAYSAVSRRTAFDSAKKYAVVSLDHARNCQFSKRLLARWPDVVEVPNGVDVTLFRPDREGGHIRRQYGIPAASMVVLFVATLDQAHSFKGLDHLMRALILMRQPNVTLLVVGDGDLRPALQAQAARLGLADCTVFAGSIANEALPDYYRAADIFVLPSFPPESFGIVLIEAMACGRPVVAQNIPGVRAVVSDGVDGLLARPGDVASLADKLLTLAGSADTRQAMGARGRAKVEAQYAWPRVVDRLESLYADVMAQRPAWHVGAQPHGPKVPLSPESTSQE